MALARLSNFFYSDLHVPNPMRALRFPGAVEETRGRSTAATSPSTTNHLRPMDATSKANPRAPCFPPRLGPPSRQYSGLLQGPKPSALPCIGHPTPGHRCPVEAMKDTLPLPAESQ